MTTPARLVQLALSPGAGPSAAVANYVAPDHSAGEQWPGTQRPTRQLSLFEVTKLRAPAATTDGPARAISKAERPRLRPLEPIEVSDDEEGWNLSPPRTAVALEAPG